MDKKIEAVRKYVEGLDDAGIEAFLLMLGELLPQHDEHETFTQLIIGLHDTSPKFNAFMKKQGA